MKVYNTVLRDAVSFVNEHLPKSAEVKTFTKVYQKEKSKYSSGIAHSSIGLDREDIFGDDFDFSDVAKIALGGPFGFVMASSRRLTDAVALDEEAEIKAKRMKGDATICKAIRKRCREGEKLIRAFSERIKSLMSCGPYSGTAVLPLAESLFQVITVDVVDNEGRLLSFAETLFKTKLKEVSIE